MLGSAEGWAMIIGIFALAYLLWMAILIGGYVLKGLGLSRLAKNAGMPNPALAWVPVASSWLLGSLCDRSQQAVTGKRWRFDLLLPILEVLASASGSLLAGPGGLLALSVTGYSYSTLRDALKLLLGLGYLAILGIALWCLYQDYVPERALPYTIFSVVFGRVGRGVLLLIIRDKTPLSAGGQAVPPPSWQGGPGTGGSYHTGTGTTGWGPPPDPRGTTGWRQSSYQSGPGTTGWNQPPYQGGPGPTGWNQPPYQSGPGTTGWDQPPYQSGPGITGWDQPPGQAGDQPSAPEVPPARPFRWDSPRDGEGPGGGPEL